MSEVLNRILDEKCTFKVAIQQPKVWSVESDGCLFAIPLSAYRLVTGLVPNLTEIQTKNAVFQLDFKKIFLLREKLHLDDFKRFEIMIDFEILNMKSKLTK